MEERAEQLPQDRHVVARELVKLYARVGDPDQTLKWAQVAMQNNPDPQAYLAGAYALLRQFADAEVILLQELEEEQGYERKLALLWQAADLYAAAGDRAKAEEMLADAVDWTAGRPDEAIARRRLESFVALKENLPSGEMNED